MSDIPKAHEIYRHFKGGLYQIIAVAEHTETGGQLVVYQALYGENKIYARPLDAFMERLDPARAEQSGQEYRFVLQDSDETQTPDIDPLVMQFLEADTYLDRLNILHGLHHRITDDMITTMAVASDVEVPEGELEERYQGLKACLTTLERFECNRIR